MRTFNFSDRHIDLRMLVRRCAISQARATLRRYQAFKQNHTFSAIPQFNTRNMASEGAGTHKDPVTGEFISKTYVSRRAGCHRGVEHDRTSNRELKRREKQRERDARKAEKAAAAPAAQDGTANAPNEDDLNPNVSHPSPSHPSLKQACCSAIL